MYSWIITASLWNVTGALRVVLLNPTWKGLSIEKYLSKNLGITWIKPYIHPDCRLLSQHNEIAVFLSIIIFCQKKKKSPAALLSPCKFLPGVNVAQSSCLCSKLLLYQIISDIHLPTCSTENNTRLWMRLIICQMQVTTCFCCRIKWDWQESFLIVGSFLPFFCFHTQLPSISLNWTTISLMKVGGTRQVHCYKVLCCFSSFFLQS